jgi:hypothetical protein
MRIPFIAAGLLLAAGSSFVFAQVAQTAALPFSVSNPICSQFDDGPPLGSLRPVAGEVVHFSFIAEGYTVSDTRKVSLTGHAQAFDPYGKPIAPAEEILVATTLSEEDKNWKPKFRTEFALPTILSPGSYTVKFDVTDEQSKQTVSGQTSFDVDGKFLAPSKELMVRELNFYRNQEDNTPLITPVYRAGDMVWVKFYITGYKIGEQNSIDASYDVEVLEADGTSLMKKEDAAMEKSTDYYPQPYIPGIFNLTLKSTMSHNVYTLVITAHDNVGNQTAVAKSKFQVN